MKKRPGRGILWRRLAIELELTDHGMGEIRALSPEEAWRIARERDAQKDPPVELDTAGD